MKYTEKGRITAGVGGLYTVEMLSDGAPLSGMTVSCRACGAFRHDRVTPLVGDIVTVTYTDESFRLENGKAIPSPDGTDILMTEIAERKNSLIRPPLANLDYCFVTFASAKPAPMVDMIDKLLCILEFNKVEPVVVIGKSELDSQAAEALSDTYTKSGFTVFTVSCFENSGIGAVKSFIDIKLPGKTAAIAGASGVGKSTLLNRLFPEFNLATSDISRKIQRGRHTTREVSLFKLQNGGYIADTPGFSMLDFEHFDFFDKDDLPYTFREIPDYIGQCKYTKCTHTKEEGCAIIQAVNDGIIPKSRHESFVALYDILKKKHPWDKQ